MDLYPYIIKVSMEDNFNDEDGIAQKMENILDRMLQEIKKNDTRTKII